MTWVFFFKNKTFRDALCPGSPSDRVRTAENPPAQIRWTRGQRSVQQAPRVCGCSSPAGPKAPSLAPPGFPIGPVCSQTPFPTPVPDGTQMRTWWGRGLEREAVIETDRATLREGEFASQTWCVNVFRRRRWSSPLPAPCFLIDYLVFL